MSLAIAIKSPEGLVLAADSRVTLTATDGTGTRMALNYDNATKLFRFSEPNNHVAVATYGAAVVPGTQRTAASFVPEFEGTLGEDRLTSLDFATSLSQFFMQQWTSASTAASNPVSPDMSFLLAGFDEADPYGHVYEFRIPSAPQPFEHWPNDFGMRWGGQTDVVSRMINGVAGSLPSRLEQALGLDPNGAAKLHEAIREETAQIPWSLLPLQDAVDLASLLMQATVGMQRLSITLRGVGGPVDLFTLTRTEGVRVVRYKEVRVDG